MDDFNTFCRNFRRSLSEGAPAPQALILADGRGLHLGVHVDETAKNLLEVGVCTLLDHQLSMLAAVGIYDICVVAGCHHDEVARVCRGRAYVLNNPNWAETNSLYSLWLARDWVMGQLVVMNCDVLADPNVLSRLLDTASSSFAFDSSSGEDDEHMKVELSGSNLRSMSKTLDASRVHGENVGILQFSAADAQDLFLRAGSILKNGGRKMWMAVAVQALARDHPLLGVDISDLSWIEIGYSRLSMLRHSRCLCDGETSLHIRRNTVAEPLALSN